MWIYVWNQTKLIQVQRKWLPVPDTSRYPILVVMVISSGEKWLTSRLILQQSGPDRISDTPPDSWPCSGGWPLNGAIMGDCVYPGQEKVESLLLAQSIHVRSLGSSSGGRPKSWLKMRCGCVQFGKGSQPTSRRNIGRDNALTFCGSPMFREQAWEQTIDSATHNLLDVPVPPWSTECPRVD